MKKILLTFATLSVIGCSATKLNENASLVMVSPNAAPSGCKYLGTVSGTQGGYWTGAYTTNENLDLGAMNNFKNNAYKMGANYVQMSNNLNASGHNGTSLSQISYNGVAYSCPQNLLPHN